MTKDSLKIRWVKWRIRQLEYAAFRKAGKDIPKEQTEAQELRKKYGLQNYRYEKWY